MLKFKTTLMLISVPIILASCGRDTAMTESESSNVSSKPEVVTIRPAEVNEANGWKNIVPGYWTKTEDYMGGPLITTYIDNKVRAAVEYEINSYEAAKSRLLKDLSQQDKLENDSYKEFLNELIANFSKNNLSALFVCTSSPVFSVGPYNNGSRVGVTSYVSGSCTNGGRASSIAKYNGVVSNIYDSNSTQSRTYSATSDATRYTLSPSVNSATDCGEARMGNFSSTVKRHWGNANDCISYN